MLKQLHWLVARLKSSEAAPAFCGLILEHKVRSTCAFKVCVHSVRSYCAHVVVSNSIVIFPSVL